MELRERIDEHDDAERKFQMAMHGAELTPGGPTSGQPIVGTDPTQGTGTDAWQRALNMGLQINARNRRN